ncbi:MAG TPA: FGGY-family carbohydrate kinase [Acidimicrobiales bacterium]|nr:FGGY-family carbohydrate kinase [Acidimicrobiales bacterium]
MPSVRQVGAVTAGIDIGTTAVKAVAVAPDGTVVARARVAHRLVVPAAGRLEHDARSWGEGARRALDEVAGARPVAVAVAALAPSMTAVDADGTPVLPGVLYDDDRGRAGPPGADPTESGEGAALLAWAAAAAPGAAAYWPAQAAANRALGGPAAVDYATACAFGPLFDGAGWSAAAVAAAGARPGTLPEVRFFGEAIGAVAGDGPVLAAGGVDALCEQLVAGADGPGDALVVLGSTLVTWVNSAEPTRVPGLWTLPHLRAGWVVGGPSNAGGLFTSWADRLLAPAGGCADQTAVPVWWPHVRGERVPLHDPGRRGALGGLDLRAGPAELRRASREASGFVVRHVLEAAGGVPDRVVLTGGGVRDRGWVQAIADVLGRPVVPVAVPEGAALGAAWLARMGAGVEGGVEGAGAWARHSDPVDPDPAWVASTADRYARYRDGIAEGGALHVR